MNALRTSAAAALLGMSLAVLPNAAAAQTTTYTYRVAGTEVYASSATGVFVGIATDSAPDTWWTEVDHEPLGPDPNPRHITGGSFVLVQTSPAHVVTGHFSGGTIEQIDPRPGCTDQVYRVHGPTTVSAGGRTGFGMVDVDLTHHRKSIFGRCLIYAATVTGDLEVTVPSS